MMLTRKRRDTMEYRDLSSGLRAALLGVSLIIVAAAWSACFTAPPPVAAAPVPDADSTEDLETAEALRETAWSLILEGDYSGAVERLDQAIILDPENRLGYAYRSEALRLRGDYRAAITDLDRALELWPEDPWSLGRRGEAYRSLAEYQHALTDLNDAILLDSNDSYSYASRGEVYRQTEDYEAAIKDFDRAIELAPEYPWALARRGEAHRMLDALDNALEDLSRAIELAPEDSFAYASRGETYSRLGDFDRAVADFDTAIALDPGYSWAIERRAEAVEAGAAETESSDGEDTGNVKRPEGLPLVAVLGFQIENLPASEGKLILDLLTSALVGTRRFRVLDRSQQEAVLREIEFSLSDCADEKCQIEAGRLLAADQIVVGSLGRVGQRYVISAKLLEVQSGEVLGSAYQVYRSLEELVDGCPEIADSLRP
jgi:tetratricopeptide (TPR) repeat protein